MQVSQLYTKARELGIKTVILCRKIQQELHEYVITNQLMKSGTSIMANIAEANAAESRRDFIHKLGIARKEVNETLAWIECSVGSGIAKPVAFEDIKELSEQVYKMINATIKTIKLRSSITNN